MERKVQKILESQLTLEGAGVKLKRVLGNDDDSTLDPFLLLDHFGSDNPEDYIKGFPWPIKAAKGVLGPQQIETALRPENIHYPVPALVCVENTHNRYGGTVVSPKQLETISNVAKRYSLKVYMDGARIFNAAVALNLDVKEFTKHVDNLMFCLSKGLSCPVGSIIVGNKDFIDRARKNRKLLGGGMRQAGIIAAPGIIALENMIDRLKIDHDNAKLLGEKLIKIRGVNVDLKNVQTNMVTLSLIHI